MSSQIALLGHFSDGGRRGQVQDTDERNSVRGRWPLGIRRFSPWGTKGTTTAGRTEDANVPSRRVAAGFFGRSGFRPTEATGMHTCGISCGRSSRAAAQLMLSWANPTSLLSSGISEPSTPDASLKVTDRFDWGSSTIFCKLAATITKSLPSTRPAEISS